mmetsp:Transcript_11052/g.25589  ORF Transcript_11052/g.25589 Transcript_11052/m.25589 type:complete len:427 (-) Transcript_11052:225-1505(-)
MVSLISAVDHNNCKSMPKPPHCILMRKRERCSELLLSGQLGLLHSESLRFCEVSARRNASAPRHLRTWEGAHKSGEGRTRARTQDGAGVAPLPSVTTPSERASLGVSSPRQWLQLWEATHHPPAFRRARDRSDAPSRVPRLIFQTSHNATQALSLTGSWMRTWWELNREFDYHLFGDGDAWDFVMRFCSSAERAAYAKALVGAQRADLFRVYFLRALGGVYADTDTQLRAPLRTLLGVANASAVLSGAMDFDFLVFAPGHPLLDFVAHAVTRNVHEQADRLLLARAPPSSAPASPRKPPCTGAHTCITGVTGPYAYRGELRWGAEQLGCTLKGGKVVLTEKGCRRSTDEAMRTVQRCADLEGWYCGVAKHFDCRNSAARRPCGKEHYSSKLDATAYFNLSIGRDYPALAPTTSTPWKAHCASCRLF